MIKNMSFAQFRHGLLAVLCLILLLVAGAILVIIPVKYTIQNATSYSQKVEHLSTLEARLQTERQVTHALGSQYSFQPASTSTGQSFSTVTADSILAHFQDASPSATLLRSPETIVLSDGLTRSKFTLSVSGDGSIIMSAIQDLPKVSAEIERIEFKKIDQREKLDVLIHFRSYQLTPIDSKGDQV